MTEKTEPIREDFTVSPSFTAWPYRSFKQFKDYAKLEAGDCYWLAVDKLMERSKRLDLMEQQMNLFTEEETTEEPDPNYVRTLGD